jgi:hypothetical protein
VIGPWFFVVANRPAACLMFLSSDRDAFAYYKIVLPAFDKKTRNLTMEVEGLTELPAGSPLTEGIFLQVLKGAASSDPQRIRTSTTQLEEWQTRTGYFILLQSAFADRTLPFEVRYLASIQLKNGVDKFWRKHANNEIAKSDKEQIRSQLLNSGVNESDPRIAFQIALVVAKIGRYDFPAQW